MFAGPDFGPKGRIICAAATYALMLLSYRVINVSEPGRDLTDDILSGIKQ